MVTENSFDILVMILGGCLILLFVAIFVLRFMGNVYMPFIEERDIIKMEIMRSHGEERAHWQRELKRLRLSMIPVIGGLLVRHDLKKRHNSRR